MYERKFAPIGQGFMVRGIANGNVTFRNTHRVFRKEGLAIIRSLKEIAILHQWLIMVTMKTYQM
jgi:hypothetical protein